MERFKFKMGAPQGAARHVGDLGLPSKRSKNHHYLAEGFQKRFIEGFDALYYSKRDAAGRFGCIEVRNPNENGNPTDIVEREFYSRVDDLLCKLIDEIRPLVRKRENFDISEQSDFTLRIIFIEMMRRVPEFQKNFPSNYLSQLDITGAEFLERFPERESEIRKAIEKRYNNPQELQNVGLETRTIYPKQILKGMNGMSFNFAILPRNTMFILSSNMIQRLSNKGNGSLDHPKTELWFPIDPHVAIVAARVDPSFPQFVEMDQKFAKEYNNLAVGRSDEIASPSRRLLSALIRRRMS